MNQTTPYVEIEIFDVNDPPFNYLAGSIGPERNNMVSCKCETSKKNSWLTLRYIRKSASLHLFFVKCSLCGHTCNYASSSQSNAISLWNTMRTLEGGTQ